MTAVPGSSSTSRSTIERFEVDGVPVLGAVHDGPVRGALLFRVGTIDEPLARRGMTHLCEHLAIETLGRPVHPHNGMTGPTVTAFVAEGTADEVGQYFTRVCSALGDLPAERFEVERNVLSAEAIGRNDQSVVTTLWALRFGAVGWGALELGEVGLGALTFDELRAWSSACFTTGNAVAWITGPDPHGVLDALPLPPGGRLPIPEPRTVLPELPAWAHANVSGPGVGMTGRRSVALRWAVGIAAQRATERLRGDRGIVYGVVPTYEPLTATTAHVHVGADAAEEHRAEVADGIHAALAELRDDGPTDDELARARRNVEDCRPRPGDRDAAWVAGAAVRLLEGVEPETQEQLTDEERTMTAAAVRDVLDEAWPSRLLVLPTGTVPPDEGFAAVPMWSAPVAHTGEEFVQRGVARQEAQRVRIGDGIFSLEVPGQGTVVIRADECPAVLTWDDGARLLVGADGFRVHIVPWGWERGDALVAAVDAFVPAERRVRRGPGTGPPAATAAPRAPGLALAPEPGTRNWRLLIGPSKAAAYVLWALAALFLLTGVADLVNPPPDVERGDAVTGVVIGALLALAGWKRWPRRSST